MKLIFDVKNKRIIRTFTCCLGFCCLEERNKIRPERSSLKHEYRMNWCRQIAPPESFFPMSPRYWRDPGFRVILTNKSWISSEFCHLFLCETERMQRKMINITRLSLYIQIILDFQLQLSQINSDFSTLVWKNIFPILSIKFSETEIEVMSPTSSMPSLQLSISISWQKTLVRSNTAMRTSLTSAIICNRA